MFPLGGKGQLGVLGVKGGGGVVYETPDYGNPGGIGNRTALITVTTTLSVFGATSLLVNGNTTTDDFYFLDNADVTGLEIAFDFSAIAETVKLAEFRFYKPTANAQSCGIWQPTWDGVPVGGTLELGGAGGTPLVYTVSGTGAVFKLVGVSGNTPVYQTFEVEFKIGAQL